MISYEKFQKGYLVKKFSRIHYFHFLKKKTFSTCETFYFKVCLFKKRKNDKDELQRKEMQRYKMKENRKKGNTNKNKNHLQEKKKKKSKEKDTKKTN